MASHEIVLLVVESRELGKEFARLFQPFGARYQLHTADSGDVAKAHFQGSGKYSDRTQYPRPDLLILDLQIPNADGFEVLDWIGRQEELEDIGVMVLTGEMPQLSRAYEMGANAFLTKPPTFGELRDVLLAFQGEGQAEAPEITEGPMVVVKSELMGLREAFEQA